MLNRMVQNSEPYQYVQGLAPYTTPHNMSYQTTSTMDMGILYPNFYQICYPGDKCKLDAEAVIRFNPQLAPLMHEITAKVMWFFTPNRILWKGDKTWNFWETYITGSVEGKEIGKYNKTHASAPVNVELQIHEHLWDPYRVFNKLGQEVQVTNIKAEGAEIGKIWEAIGLPHSNQLVDKVSGSRLDWMPINLPKLAYNKIYNEWFRNEDIQDEIDIKCDFLQKINWGRDYLTACATEQQKGIAPMLGMDNKLVPVNLYDYAYPDLRGDNVSDLMYMQGTKNAENTTLTYTGGYAAGDFSIGGTQYAMGVDVPGLNINVSSLRNMISIQKALELDMRAGTRYPEYLQANFNTKPKDERLSRPEYIGSKTFPISVNEVLQTSESATTPLGSMGGHALGMMKQGGGKQYYCQEHGVLMGIVVIQPKPQYQQGIHRDLLAQDRYDWYRPQFAFLSEQPVYLQEVYSRMDGSDKKVFGFQGNFDHMRQRNNQVMGLMRANADQNLSFWNLARYFENEPTLSGQFLECIPRKDFLVAMDEPAMIVTIGWHNYMMRMIPSSSEPGMLDHAYGEQSKGANTMPRMGKHIS